MILFGLFLIFSNGMGSASAASGDTIYVNGTSGNNAYNGQSAVYTSGTNGPKATIKNATGTVNSNGTIHIAQGTYYESNIQINTNMTIIGENQKNTIINGQKSGLSIFTIASGLNITIINLTLTNGKSNTNGGAIYNNGGTLTVDSSTFNNNTSTHGGSAIFNTEGSILTVDSSTFTNNAVTTSGGGAIYNYHSSTLTVMDSTFTFNTATSGGAIFNNNDSSVTVINSIFTSNTASTYGGAIYNTHNMTVTSSIFTNNTANYGGAVYNGGTCTLNYNRIYNNSAPNGDAIHCSGSVDATNNWWGSNTPLTIPNLISISGGSVDANPWIVLGINSSKDLIGTGESSIISVNLRYNSDGQDISSYGTVPDVGVLFNSSIGSFNPTNGTINNSQDTTTTFTADPSPAINVVTATVDSQTVNTTIRIMDRSKVYVATTGDDDTGNGTPQSPFKSIAKAISELQSTGTVYVANGTYKEHLNINKNMIIAGQSQTNTIIDGQQSEYSIFTIASGVKLTIINLTLTNEAAINGTINNPNGILTVENCTITNTTSTYGSGGINNGGTLTVVNSTFINNSAKNDGGAINNYGGTVTVENSTFINNTANKGGAINNYQSLTVMNCTFINNTATINAGAIYNAGTLIVTDSTFTNNTANNMGGAIYDANHSTLTNCIFTSNIASNTGGAIANSGGTTTTTTSTFNKNTAKNGGAIYNTGTITVNKSTFTGNTVTNGGGGGAIINYGTLTVDNSTFTNNTATSSGAIYNMGTLTVNNSTFTGNIVTNGGGAIYNSGILTVNNSTFTNNTATSGGAIYNMGTLTVNNSTFTNNTATTGGAISNGDTLTVNNSTFTNNTATSGGAISNGYGGIANVNFNRIIGNTASSGSAINCFSGTVDARYNWWGSNTSPSSKVNGGVTITPWLVLTITANPNIIVDSGNSTITADLLHDSNGIIHDPIDGVVPDDIPVNFTTTLGTISSPLNIVNGTANSILNSESLVGTAYVTITVDSQSLQTQVLFDNVPPTAGANPTGGLYNTTKTVTLNMSEPGKIYYTTDGTVPTMSSNIYTNPITINTSTILKFFAINLAGNTSPIYTQTYTIDTIAPTASANPTGGLYNTTKNVVLTMSEPGTIYYTTNGTTPTTSSNTYTGPITISSSTILKFFAIDLAGNPSPIYTQTYTIDTIAPTASANPTGGLYNTNKNVVLTMSEPGTIYYTTDGTTPTTSSNIYNGPITISSSTILKYLAIESRRKSITNIHTNLHNRHHSTNSKCKPNRRTLQHNKNSNTQHE